MPGLSVAEKNHWKERISHRFDKQIEALVAEDVTFFARVKQQAYERALQSLGLAESQVELKTLKLQQEELEQREEQLLRQMVAKIRGVPPESVNDYSSYHSEDELRKAIERRQQVHEEQLIGETELGQRIQQWRAEKENLLDTIWLATSPQQVKTLWSKVSELIGDKESPLQRAAIAMEAISE